MESFTGDFFGLFALGQHWRQHHTGDFEVGKILAYLKDESDSVRDTLTLLRAYTATPAFTYKLTQLRMDVWLLACYTPDYHDRTKLVFISQHLVMDTPEGPNLLEVYYAPTRVSNPTVAVATLLEPKWRNLFRVSGQQRLKAFREVLFGLGAFGGDYVEISMVPVLEHTDYWVRLRVSAMVHCMAHPLYTSEVTIHL